MERKIGNKIAWAVVCSLGLLLLVGCGGSSDRQALEGTVTLDGTPIAEGRIKLCPLPGTRGPTAGGKISEGTFSISPEGGTFIGTFRVEITASHKTGRKQMDLMSGSEVDEVVQFIPVRYNRQSELTAEVTEAGPNRYEFAITTK